MSELPIDGHKGLAPMQPTVSDHGHKLNVCFSAWINQELTGRYRPTILQEGNVRFLGLRPQMLTVAKPPNPRRSQVGTSHPGAVITRRVVTSRTCRRHVRAEKDDPCVTRTSLLHLVRVGSWGLPLPPLALERRLQCRNWSRHPSPDWLGIPPPPAALRACSPRHRHPPRSSTDERTVASVAVGRRSARNR